MRITPTLCLTALGTAALLLVAPAANASPGQVVTDLTTATAQQLADSIAGSGFTTSNVVYTGSPRAAGLFTGMSASGIDSGVVLSSGSVVDIVGPNDGNFSGGSFNLAGDTDIDALIAPLTSEDASVLEFDFVPTGTLLSFQYVFGSEEQPVDSSTPFADAAALFINGVNCAVVPDGAGGTSPVTNATVNPTTNAALYRDNTSSAIDVEFEGLTTVLTCTAPVTAGAVNTFKLVVADASDASVDAAVLIQAGAVTVTAPPIPAPAATPLLAATGTDSLALVGAGGLAVLLGIATLGFRRRRSTVTA